MIPSTTKPIEGLSAKTIQVHFCQNWDLVTDKKLYH